MVPPHRPRNTRPRLLNNQHAFDILQISTALSRGRRLSELLPSLSVQNTSDNTEERHGGTTRLGGDRTGEGLDHVGASLGLPPGIDDGTLAAPDVLVVPQPSLGVDRLADGAEDAEG